MRWDLMIEAGPVVVVHAVAAVLAFALGMAVLWRRKGGRWHKMLGKVWVLLMLVVALSSFGIHEIRAWGPFSPIHLLSVYTIGSLIFAVYAIRSGFVKQHRSAMVQLYVSGLVVAGAFTFLPHRLLPKFLGSGDIASAMPFLWIALPAAVWLAHRYDVMRRLRTAYPKIFVSQSRKRPVSKPR